MTGSLRDSDQPGILRWQNAAFTSPFDFEVDKITSVVEPPPAQPSKPSGDFRFELAGGDVVFGTLVNLDDKVATLDLSRFGSLKIKRAGLLRMDRWRENADLIYLGPNGLTGWTVSKPDQNKPWRDDSGELISEKDGSSIRGDVGLPARAAIEFELSWKKTPDFVLAFGVDATEITAQRAFRLEVWDNELAVTREGEKDADVASVGMIAQGTGRLHLRLLLDQEKGTMTVVSPDGKILGQLSCPEKNPRVYPGIRLENKRGDIRLERLQVTRWNGETPSEVPLDRSSLLLMDGSSHPGRITGYDETAKAYVVVDSDKESRISHEQVARIIFSRAVAIPHRSLRAVFQDGSRLSGDILKVEKGSLFLTNAYVDGPEKLPLEGLRSLSVLQDPDSSPKKLPIAQTPRLEMEGMRLIGTLADGKTAADATCLAWKPWGSRTAGPLRPGLAGKLLYKEPAVVPPSSTTSMAGQRGMAMIQQIQPARPAVAVNAPAALLGGVIRVFGGVAQPATPVRTSPSALSPTKRALHLRTGDIIPASIERIDEEGVTFKTALSKNTFVANDKVKAVELAAEPAVTVRLNKAKRERLLTLPRAQKGNPPTHMIRSTNGDLLRGRLVSLDDKALQVEIRLETKPLPRDRVSRIIWLHPEEIVGPKPPKAGAENKDTTFRVQAVRSDGIRLTFSPDMLVGTTLSGKSDVLGDCQVRLDEVDQLLIAGAIEKVAATLIYQQWVLKDAIEPKSAEDDDGSSGGRSPGTESPLVGKPAPDFKLDLLDGKPYHLADMKGKVVMLDFWATWCGPCIQAMPQVEKVAEEFRDQGVQLIAVNLQESPRDINAMLERHKLKVTVALDRDGVVAERYKANAIPQTVIIDREGNVARLFVGGGPQLAEQLRGALKGVLERTENKEPAK